MSTQQLRFTRKTFGKIPELTGIYIFFDEKGTILYIGKAINLRRRVSSYFQKTDHEVKIALLIPQIRLIEITIVQSEFEALLLESQLIREHLPKYNSIWRDDKSYLYITVTREEFPRPILSRKKDNIAGVSYGPFSSGRTARSILSYLRKIIPYCTQPPRSKRSCFHTHIGLCNPCPADIRKNQEPLYSIQRKLYISNIRKLRLILSGKIQQVLRQLEKQMASYAKKEEYEQATVARNQITQLGLLRDSYQNPQEYIKNPKYSEELKKEEEHDLLRVLSPYFTHLKQIKRIECFDLSNVSGKHATGSMVTFVDGTPEKAMYRKFRIRTVSEPNDFAMLREVVTRRLRHSEWRVPDLLVVDGGKPQLLAIKQILSTLSVPIPTIGIAKRFDELVVPSGVSYKKLILTNRAPALHLIQRLRDEAHRFAQKYYKHLHLKSLLEITPTPGCAVSQNQ